MASPAEMDGMQGKWLCRCERYFPLPIQLPVVSSHDLAVSRCVMALWHYSPRNDLDLETFLPRTFYPIPSILGAEEPSLGRLFAVKSKAKQSKLQRSSESQGRE